MEQSQCHVLGRHLASSVLKKKILVDGSLLLTSLDIGVPGFSIQLTVSFDRLDQDRERLFMKDRELLSNRLRSRLKLISTNVVWLCRTALTYLLYKALRVRSGEVLN
jgi:hypothetical protein